MTTLDHLTAQFGLLMTQAQLAEILGRSVTSLSVSLSRPGGAWRDQVRAARRKFGRRVYYRTADIAALIDGNCGSD